MLYSIINMVASPTSSKTNTSGFVTLMKGKICTNLIHCSTTSKLMGRRGKVIYAEQDGFFRITLFSEFPTSDGEPPILARPKYMQTYTWKTAGKTVDDRGMWVNAYNLCLARPGK